jgi:putative nucleotidyltransferase with HDIG domain
LKTQDKDKDLNMKYLRASLTRQMMDFFGDDLRRIDHALRVLAQADRLAGPKHGCDREILIACALLHDVGIKPSEEELGYNDGKTQEQYGPPAAEKLLRAGGFPENKIGMVKDIIGNHHSPSRLDYPELELLKKADRTVNMEKDMA